MRVPPGVVANGMLRRRLKVAHVLRPRWLRLRAKRRPREIHRFVRGEDPRRRRGPRLRRVPARALHPAWRTLRRGRRQGRRRRLRRRRREDDAARRGHPAKAPGRAGRARTRQGPVRQGGSDLVVQVPMGTQVFDVETNELVFDVDAEDKRVIVARGGAWWAREHPFLVVLRPRAASRRAGRARAGAKPPAGAEGDGRRRPPRLSERRQEHLHPSHLARPSQGGRLSIHDADAAPRRRRARRGRHAGRHSPEGPARRGDVRRGGYPRSHPGRRLGGRTRDPISQARRADARSPSSHHAGSGRGTGPARRLRRDQCRARDSSTRSSPPVRRSSR